MKFSKYNITTKLIISYLLAILLSVIAFLLFYQQITRFTEVTNEAPEHNDHVFLISETITNLYEVESLGRNLVKANDSTEFKAFQEKIQEINLAIDQLVKKYPDSRQRIKINSIKDLLRRKNLNVKELTEIYNKKNSQSFYTAAVKELKRVDPTFKDYKYEHRFKSFAPHQRKYLIKLLEFSKKDNSDRLSNKTIDSIAESVTNVLLELAKKERKLQETIEEKEQEIIEDDRILTSQIRSMLTALERQELRLSAEREAQSQKILARTYKIILFSTLLTLLTALTFLYFINKDVKTNAKRNKQLEEAKAYAEELLQSKENLMNMVTHDVRAPLHTIMGYLELLQNSAIHEKEKYYVNQVQKSSDYMLHLVNDLLDFSKAEAGKLSIEKVTFQPSVIVDNAIKQGIPSGNPKNLQLSYTIDDKLKRLFSSDPYRIKQIAINLITNAYKFTETGFVNVEASYKEEDDISYLVLKVADSGVGISEEKQEKIFEAFSQGEANKHMLYEGFGLGLYITKSIVDLLNGQLKVESELGRGSTFTCAIPLLKMGDLVENGELKKPKQRKTINTVLVDDDPAQLSFLEQIFDQNNIKYQSFNNANKAIEYMKKNKPDIALTDIQMPVIDGFEFLEKVKNEETIADVPIIALTGNTKFSNDTYIKKGFAKRFLKPYSPVELLNIISDILNIEIEQPKLTAPQTNRDLISEDYDLTSMAAFVDNDMESVKKILTTFLETTEEQIPRWEKAVKKKDYKMLQHLAHKMNPMFTQVNAEGVYRNLRSVEIHTGKPTSEFYKMCAETTEAIKRTINGLKKFT